VGIRQNNIDHYVPKLVIIKGIKIAFFGYCNACPNEFGPRSNTAGVNVGMKKMIKEQVMLTKHYLKPDFIIAMPHWGTEYAGVDKNQRFTAQALRDAGVDIVVGAHPHVLQKVEAGENFVVAYSLGNFLFPMRWKISLDSAILMMTLNKDTHEVVYKYAPVSLDSNRPVLLEDGDDGRRKRDMYILYNGYDYPEDRRWPESGPWSKNE
jgi:poly-gamma-glutamate synthesis protein (capsule biosynthesis protein)